MTGTWAIARHMIAEGVRLKLALVFIVFMGLIVLGLSFSVEGGGSLNGAGQSFLSHGLDATTGVAG